MIPKTPTIEAEGSTEAVAGSVIGLGSLWTVRLAALMSILLLCFPSFSFLFHDLSPCEPRPLSILPVMILPYLAILFCIGLVRPSWRLKRGLAVSIWWSTPFLVLPLVLLFFRGTQESFSEAVAASSLGWKGAALLLGAQAGLLLGAIATYYSGRRERGDWKILVPGLHVLVPVLVLLIVVGIALPPPFDHPGPNEGSARSSVRSVVTAQITYSATTGKGSYAPDLDTLGEASLIDDLLASGIKDGYEFSTSSPTPLTITVLARPLEYGRTGCRGFFSDESNVIRWTREERPASQDDPPL